MREQFDVFISYAHADGEAVRRLVEALEARGLAVYIDRDIADFESITGSIERGLARSRALLAFYSKRYATSRPCQWELTAAFLAAQREGDGGPRRRVLVVNPEPDASHIQPGELQDARFRKPGDAAGLAESVAAHVATLDGLLGEVRPLVPPSWYPHQRAGSNRFVGRLADMWEVHTALHADKASLITGAVSSVAQVRGIGGVGKSLLAEEYALRFGAAYPGGVFWLHGGELGVDPVQREAEREGQLRALAALVDPPSGESSPHRTLRRWIEERAEQTGPCLWVVDDLPPGLGREVSRWLAPHPAAKTLITTRSREHQALGHLTDLTELPDPEALGLLTARQQPEGPKEWAAAAAIATELGGHPLALDVAAAALRDHSFAGFLGALNEPSDDWLERLTAQLRDELPNGHERSIAGTLQRSIDQLGEEGRDFLRLAAVLAEAPMSADLVAAVFATVDGLTQLEAEARRGHALDQVIALSLADNAGARAWRVHALVKRAVRFTDSEPERRERIRHAAIAALTAELLAIVHPGGERRVAQEFRYVAIAVSVGAPEAIIDPSALDRVAGVVSHARALTQRASDPDELDLLGLVAVYDYQQSDYASAQALSERQYETRRSALGDDHAETLASLSNVAATALAQGDLDGARELQERVLELRRQACGEAHPDTLASVKSLADTLQAQGDLEGVRRLLEETAELCRSELGDEHPDTLTSVNTLALARLAQGDLDGARKLQKRALELCRTVRDADSRTLMSLKHLAVALSEHGDLEGTRRVDEATLELCRRLRGDEHEDTLVALSNLAVTVEEQGDLAGARRLHEMALEGFRRALGDEHPKTLTSAHNLVALQARSDLERTARATPPSVTTPNPVSTGVASWLTSLARRIDPNR